MAAEEIRKYSMVPERKTYQSPPTPKKKQQPLRKSWFSKGEKVLYSAGIIIVAIAMIFTVQYSSSIDTLNRDIQQVNQNITHYQSENTTLVAEVKEMSKPSRILAIAEEHGLNIKNAKVKQASQSN
ncbi:cell division protein FtsL [Filobacillus milosensis]|uniref:Cell division protein FtsL n=1 Tax=Filobacillus milosensis TaxID=94137 RepID=A0A4Y8IR90_9BACI|nr:cell division protein FtsL [Filobacillus milosensis]TFB23304.1 cell division protein FtsL [Filobacillus milosensis]